MFVIQFLIDSGPHTIIVQNKVKKEKKKKKIPIFTYEMVGVCAKKDFRNAPVLRAYSTSSFGYEFHR
jgi:hypothetical protein